METRKIYRGNFVNFMTGEVDYSLARSSEYTLKIVEDKKSYFYHVRDVDGELYSIYDTNSEKLSTCVLTDWSFLNDLIQWHHIFTVLPNANDNSIEDALGSKKEACHLSDWVKQFENSLPIPIVLKLYDELEYCFEKIQLQKTYKLFLKNAYSFKVLHQIDEFQIDKQWYLYLGRELDRGKLSPIFQYNLKHSYTVYEERETFQNNCSSLEKEFAIPQKLISAVLRSSHGNVELCKSILQDMLSTRKNILFERLSPCDEVYVECLTADNFFENTPGLEHFIKDWKKVGDNFQTFGKFIKNGLINFLLG